MIIMKSVKLKSSIIGEWVRKVKKSLGLEKKTSLEGAPEPIYSYQKRVSRRKVIEILISFIPVIPIALITLGYQGALVIKLAVALAIIAFFMQPIIVSLNEAPGKELAKILYDRGLLIEWASYSWKIPFIARLSGGFSLTIFTERLGFRTRIVISKTSSQIPLAVSPQAKPKLRIIRCIKLIENPSVLEDITSRTGIYEIELIQPSLRNKFMLTMYKGAAFIADLLNVSDPSNVAETIAFGVSELSKPILISPVHYRKKEPFYEALLRIKKKISSLSRGKSLAKSSR